MTPLLHVLLFLVLPQASLLLATRAEGLSPPSCSIPTGLDKLNLTALRLPADGAYFSVVGANFPALVKYETPIQFEIVQVGTITLYNAAAAYHPSSLDLFGRPIDYRICQNQPNQEYFKLHRQLTLIYAMYFNALPQAVLLANEVMRSFNLPIDICDLEGACEDPTTPWGLGKMLSAMRLDWQPRNGWNADGSLSRTHFKVPYDDWMSPTYERIRPKPKERTDAWKPMEEHNGLGYVYEQRYVTPHIGQRARSIVFNDSFLCSLKAPKPRRVRLDWLRDVANRTATLDDRKKTEAELFDNKFSSLLPLLVQYFVRKNVSINSFEFIQADSVIISMLYEATIVAWKEKVRHSLVRPTTAIHDMLKGTSLLSYAGPGLGPQPVKASEWHSYLRTMPHAEYPSGSSCVCEGFARAMQELEGTDDIAPQIQGPLVVEIPAGSSKIEPGITPSQNMTLVYFKWSEISDSCAESRLNAGVHFPRSVEAGKALCMNMSKTIVGYFRSIASGIRPRDSGPDFDVPFQTVNRCRGR